MDMEREVEITIVCDAVQPRASLAGAGTAVGVHCRNGINEPVVAAAGISGIA
jgi:hypothetical protein